MTVPGADVTGRLLVVVRHGRTRWNAEGRFQGRADPPLDPEGVRQARACAAGLRARFDRAGLGPPEILTSDLRRARDTAAALARAFGTVYSPDAALREVDVGPWEGLTRPEVERLFPDEYRAWATGTDIRRGGGETLAEAGARVAARVEEALGTASAVPLVIVGHGLSLQSALAVLARHRHVRLDGAPPHLGNGAWLALGPPGGLPAPLG